MAFMEYSPQTVAQAINKNGIDVLLFAAERGRKSFGVDQDISWVINKPYWPSFLFNPQFEVRHLKERLAQLGGRIETHRLPPIMKIGSMAKPVELVTYLEEQGCKCIYNPCGMAADLSKIREEFSIPPGFSIEVVKDYDALRAWTSISSGLELTLFNRLLSEPNLQLYIGYLDGRPVATSMVFFSADVAGLYFVFVVPDCRSRGIGTAMTLAPLLAARDLGYRVAVLQASAMGERIYRQIGFEEFFRFSYYQWKNCTYEAFRDS